MYTMLKKQETKKAVKVTFEVENPEAGEIAVLGDFNGWQPETMKKFKNGKHKLTVDLEPNREYQFRYLIDGTQWGNEAEADRHQANEHGEENSVITC
jgi:1,4-alpha-glucan branching enzyme